jgi:uncharacterized protein YxeA
MKRILGIILTILLTVGISGFIIATASFETYLMGVGAGTLVVYTIILINWLLFE